MAVSDEVLLKAAEAIASVDGLSMDPDFLVEDVFLLAYAFPDEQEFKAAVASTCKALSLIIQDRVSVSSLKYGLKSWHSYHYQHCVAQGARADCRLIYKFTDEGIEVKGFGHRRIPEDIYFRLVAGRTSEKA